MPGIFISYRRDDSAPYAGRISDRLTEHFGNDHVFLDVDDLVPGQDFVRALDQTLEACDVVIALIGRSWLMACDEQGRRRLDIEEDYVRREIATGVGRSIPIIPVLVGNAKMPSAEQLPGPLAPLARRQALVISDALFHDDVDRLIAAIGAATRLGPELRLLLRSEPATVTSAEAQIMLVRHDFFCSGVNETGSGSSRQLKQKILGGTIVVVDPATGLTWEKAGSMRGISGTSEAAAHVAAANDNGLAGCAGWRLPTLEEAMSVMTAKKHGSYHLDPVFEQRAAPFVWTADLAPGGRRWLVYYADGSYGTENPSFHAYIRLVRQTGE